MKYSNIYKLALMAFALVAVSCDPIEDSSLRDDYHADNKAISQDELTAALSVSQLPNVDGKVEGDQYVTVKNTRKDLAGTWRFKRGGSVSTYATDEQTIVLGANGDYTITYVCLSGGQRVESKPFNITVTNVFDQYDNLLTGAKDKADKSASKRWKYMPSEKGNYMLAGAYGSWKYFDYTQGKPRDDTWWGNQNDLSVIGDERMEFVYDGTKYKVYTPDGSLKREGVFAYNHNAPDDGIFGELQLSIAPMGDEWNWSSGSHPNGGTWWIVALEKDRLILFYPSGAHADWDTEGWYVYYQPE